MCFHILINVSFKHRIRNDEPKLTCGRRSEYYSGKWVPTPSRLFPQKRAYITRSKFPPNTQIFPQIFSHGHPMSRRNPGRGWVVSNQVDDLGEYQYGQVAIIVNVAACSGSCGYCRNRIVLNPTCGRKQSRLPNDEGCPDVFRIVSNVACWRLQSHIPILAKAQKHDLMIPLLHPFQLRLFSNPAHPWTSFSRCQMVLENHIRSGGASIPRHWKPSSRIHTGAYMSPRWRCRLPTDLDKSKVGWCTDTTPRQSVFACLSVCRPGVKKGPERQLRTP